MKKRILSAALTIVLAFSIAAPCAFAAAPSMENFKQVQAYTKGQFRDVPSDAWFASSVENAYELGLMQGSSENYFNVEGNLTIAEAVTMAARLHRIYNTGETLNLEATTTWYDPYVDYARKNGILTTDYPNYTQIINRAQFAQIFSNALPQNSFSAINTIADNSLPDVTLTDSYGADVYVLYRAGILTGNDSYGTFAPTTSISRNAAAAIVARMAIPNLRVKFTLQTSNTAPSTPSKVVMYSDFPSVPDFGAFFGAPHCSRGSTSYDYKLFRLPDEIMKTYSDLLVDNGFVYLGMNAMDSSRYNSVDFINDEGLIVRHGYFYESEYSVLMIPKGSEGNYSKSDSIYYQDHPYVPDYGRMAGIEPEKRQGNRYIYKLENKGFDSYSQLLKENGFTLIKRIDTTDFGGEVWYVYVSGIFSVSISLSIQEINGTSYIIIEILE